MQTKINIKDPLMKPKTFAAAMDSIQNNVGLARCKDERNKVLLILKPWLLAAKNFESDIYQPSIDGEGFDCMHGIN
jgi:hypothetical protein